MYYNFIILRLIYYSAKMSKAAYNLCRPTTVLWATICKMVWPMLSDRCLYCLLSVGV